MANKYYDDNSGNNGFVEDAYLHGCWTVIAISELKVLLYDEKWDCVSWISKNILQNLRRK